jgi:hypothetical protein
MPFKKGDDKIGGRKEGTPNKSTLLMMSVKDIVLAAFHDMQADPRVNILAWGKENPTDFYKIAAKLIPQQINAEVLDKRIIVLPPSEKPKKLEE